jgi:uncharacterized membrane protein HdeD (DUF308 family)
MTSATHNQPRPSEGNTWLKPYYFSRAAVSIVWIIAALTLGSTLPGVAAVLLLFYPTWDAAANLMDAYRNGGFKRNPSQTLNAVVSSLTTLAIAVALGMSMSAVLYVFGAWAIFSGVFQLATGVRRWKTHGAQWLMILSGAQSALAGVFFLKQASADGMHGIMVVVPYVAFGAFYFLVSALWLVVVDARRRKVSTAGA